MHGAEVPAASLEESVTGERYRDLLEAEVAERERLRFDLDERLPELLEVFGINPGDRLKPVTDVTGGGSRPPSWRSAGATQETG